MEKSEEKTEKSGIQGKLKEIFGTMVKTFQLPRQLSRGVLKKRCSENMQQIYRRAPVPKCDFNKVTSSVIKITLRHGCSPVNLLHNFRKAFPKDTSGRLLL